MVSRVIWPLGSHTIDKHFLLLDMIRICCRNSPDKEMLGTHAASLDGWPALDDIGQQHVETLRYP